MKKIETLKELHDLLYEILVAFDDFCRKHDLRYFLAYGSCLGAVRHGDFIPWDDDLDVEMPRPDYDRLLDLMKTERVSDNTELLFFEKDNYYEYPFAKLVNKRTVLYEEHYKAYPMGIFMDVFPMDGGSEEPKARQIIFNKVSRQYMMIYGSCGRYEKRDVSFLNYALGCVGTFFLHRVYHQVRMHAIRKIDSMCRKISYDESEKAGSYVSGANKEEKEFFPKDTYFPVNNDFCIRGRSFPIPHDYDRYLSNIYGDYMVEQRMPGHPFNAYILEEGEERPFRRDN